MPRASLAAEVEHPLRGHDADGRIGGHDVVHREGLEPVVDVRDVREVVPRVVVAGLQLATQDLLALLVHDLGDLRGIHSRGDRRQELLRGGEGGIVVPVAR